MRYLLVLQKDYKPTGFDRQESLITQLPAVQTLAVARRYWELQHGLAIIVWGLDFGIGSLC